MISAYKVAAEGHDLQYFKNLLNDHQAAIDQEEAEKAEAEAEKAAAKSAKDSKKGKRKSKGAETDVEMEDADDSKKSKASKKRKNTETDAEADKVGVRFTGSPFFIALANLPFALQPAKTPKTNTKLKLTTPKAPEEKKTPASKTKKAPAKKGKAAPAPSDDEDASAGAKESPKPVDPEEMKKKKEKESTSPSDPDSSPPQGPPDPERSHFSVLFLRHKLQKGFISRDQPPKEDEMASMATYFDKLEKHADLEVSIIRSTKINKVLKMIVKLNSIPRDEDFNFRHRAMNILSSWKNILDADTPAGATDKDDKPTANGSNKEDDGADTPKLETEEEKEPESKSAKDDLDSPMPDADAEKVTEPENADGDKPTEITEEKTEEKSTEKSEEMPEEPSEKKTETA